MMSCIHPGSSINFDGADLQRDEEEEIDREDIKQQQELHELLSAELPDDLLEDSCDGSHNFSGNRGRRSCENSYDSGQNYPAQLNQQSYKNSHSPTAWGRNRNEEEITTQSHANVQVGGAPPFYGHATAPIRYDSSLVPSGYGPNRYTNSYNQTYTDAEKWQMQQQQQLFNPRFHYDSAVRHNGVGDYGYRGNNPSRPAPTAEVYGFPERREAEGSEDFDAVVDEDRYQNYDNKLSVTLPSFSPSGSRTINGLGKNVHFEALSAPTSPYNNHHYDVQFKPMNRNQYINSQANTPLEEVKADDSIGSDYLDATDRSTPEASNDLRELTQLRILYEARGKRIEKMTREIKSLEQEAGREKRMLSHQLAMATDQKDGMSGSLGESQRLLVEKDRLLHEEEGRTNSLKIEVETLKSAKVEFVKKLEVSERTVENLQQELAMLQRSDALERARQQHETVIAAATERHEQQLLEVTSMLDEVRRIADSKTEESEQLRVRLKAALKESEDVLLEKTETINRLSRNLEDAQNHCQTLLVGSGEVTYLKRQLSDVTKEKCSLDENSKTLKAELAEIREQLSMYESAFQLGVTPRPQASDGMTESYTELMGIAKKMDWKTPKPVNKFSGQAEDLVESLRRELERALTNNKEKRDQVVDLQNQVKDLNEESRHWRDRVDEAERLAKTDQTIASRSHPPGSADVEDLEREFQESLERVDAAEERAMRLEETCRDLKQQMCELVEQHDTNKQEAVDRCERACMQLHEDAKHAIREELLAEHEQRMYEASVEHEGNLQMIKDSLGSINKELSEVKQSYVHVCSEKDGLESMLCGKYEEEKKELLEKYEKEKKEVEEKLEVEWKNMKKQEEEEWMKNQEDNISTRIALAKVSWMEQHANLREDSVREAVKANDEEHERRIENLRKQLLDEHQEEVAGILKQERSEWETEKERELQERIDEIYEELKEQKNTAVTAAASIAQLNWITEQQNSAELEFERRLEETRQVWKKEQDEIVKREVNSAIQRMQDKIEVLNKERDTLVNEKLTKAEREWKRKRDDAVKRKEEDMQEELKKLRETHQKDYEAFAVQHKRSLETFMEKERMKSSTEIVMSAGGQEQWALELERIVQDHKRELERAQKTYDTRCGDLRAEIQRLTSLQESTLTRSVRSKDPADEIAEIEEKHRVDTERLKSKMKDEYRRWKRERSSLRAQLDEVKGHRAKPAGAPRTDQEMNFVVELREIYMATLGSVKDEILNSVRDSRTNSLKTLKCEALRERQRIAEVLKTRPRPADESILPSFLRDKQDPKPSQSFLRNLGPHRPHAASTRVLSPTRCESAPGKSQSQTRSEQSRRGRSRERAHGENRK